jgi:hypothetical protein
MSITLRDSQHLCWKTFMKLSKGAGDSQSSRPIEDLIMKTEQLAKKIKATDNLVTNEEFGRLFSELLYYIFILAEHQNVNLEESFMQTIDEIILGSIN